ncbi:NUDIX hydrolase [Anaerocolumna cellulosilytica]|uniref:NUDIX hydrolase n=1 Tax=Anaerocolumna cellulosilytica TaxID=433286 RepID=A0A6S6R1L2_9FIRM|nr:NUDIX hydrolase [Anaerocolumna cellulosilytica]MBB5195444.1 8-oxo-dGTP pyrophosphatase MutT (NUDIX family) [Anaerocolumna cellulosilytica]BCJ95976.1 NUDIX hydrolase [Anaerocolumna cellulosilytica]
MEKSLYQRIDAYKPWNEQEEKDKRGILNFIGLYDNCLLRDNEIAHITSSAWIVNKERTKVLMVYHNLYDSWAWTGGHADGESDLLKVAIKEAREETGIVSITPVMEEIFSLETLCVNGHMKRGCYVSSHLHMNVTYLLEGDEMEQLKVKADENSGVQWVKMNECIAITSEVWMRDIYDKLNQKLSLYER